MKRAEALRALVDIRPATADFIHLIAERCEGCADCCVACPALLWSMKGGTARLASDYRERCVECGACWAVCDREAIDFRYPPGASGVVVSRG